MRTTFMLSLSEELKEAVQTYAQMRNLSASDLIRQGVAKYIGYDLQADEEYQAEHRHKRGRPRIYESHEARKAAQAIRNKIKYNEAKQLLAQYDAQIAQRDRNALRDSIKPD